MRQPPMVRIVGQGAPRVNTKHAWLVAEVDGIVAFEVDMRSKHCATGGNISGDGIPDRLMIEATDESLHLHPKHKRESWTVLEFPRWPDYEIFVAEVSRYTLRVCLVKKEVTAAPDRPPDPATPPDPPHAKAGCSGPASGS